MRMTDDSDSVESGAYCNGSVPAVNGDHHSVSAGLVQATSTDELDDDRGDVQLAAQLGKALLHENEELRRTNEQMVQEFNEKIEATLSYLWMYNLLMC